MREPGYESSMSLSDQSPPQGTGDFSLRPATPEDLERIVEIESRVHQSPWSRENFEAELAKPYSHFLVLTDDETDSVIVGYVVFWVMFDECHVLNVAVDIPFRGKGHAKTMVRKAIHLATRKDIRKILLDVRRSNENAIQLYQRVGFVITHVRKSFYSDGEDAYQMALYLNDLDAVKF